MASVLLMVREISTAIVGKNVRLLKIYSRTNIGSNAGDSGKVFQ